VGFASAALQQCSSYSMRRQVRRFVDVSAAVLFPLVGIEIGMEIIYFHSEK